MVLIPGGIMNMGTNAVNGRDGESPIRAVTVGSFKIDKYPVTNSDFREFVKSQKYKTEAETFGWSFVFQDFVSEEMKSKITQKIEGSFPDGDTAEDGFHGTAPITAFPPQNNYGLFDMLGNVWEWTATPFPSAQTMYVLRGASWIDTVDGSANHRARVTTRMGNTPDSASDNLGFRCASDYKARKGRSKGRTEL
uniref:Sulfatase-modifying factor enzyme-like domain-containing protein n=1 Tax=Electrophorus electricus TaxID=8005 RepID=A0AAY5EJ99_ELEEL